MVAMVADLFRRTERAGRGRERRLSRKACTGEWAAVTDRGCRLRFQAKGKSRVDAFTLAGGLDAFTLAGGLDAFTLAGSLDAFTLRGCGDAFTISGVVYGSTFREVKVRSHLDVNNFFWFWLKSHETHEHVKGTHVKLSSQKTLFPHVSLDRGL